MEQWTSLLGVVVIQCLVFWLIAFSSKVGFPKILRIIPLCVGLGVIFGALFDIIVGSRLDVFSYPKGFDFIFMITNGALSYGLAFATAWVLPIDIGRIPFPSRLPGIIMIASALIFLWPLELLLSGSPISVFAVGMGVILFGEGVMALFGGMGPFISIFRNAWQPFLRLWEFSCLIGVAYELANHFIGLWCWHNPQGIPKSVFEFLIVLFGYFVLFHFMWTTTRVLSVRGDDLRFLQKVHRESDRLE